MSPLAVSISVAINHIHSISNNEALGRHRHNFCPRCPSLLFKRLFLLKMESDLRAYLTLTLPMFSSRILLSSTLRTRALMFSVRFCRDLSTWSYFDVNASDIVRCPGALWALSEKYHICLINVKINYGEIHFSPSHFWALWSCKG